LRSSPGRLQPVRLVDCNKNKEKEQSKSADFQSGGGDHVEPEDLHPDARRALEKYDRGGGES